MEGIVPTPLWNSCRFTLAIFAFFAFLMFYAQRVNTGFAIVCMVNQTAIRHNHNSNKQANISNNASSSAYGISSSGKEQCQKQADTSFNILGNATFSWKKDGELVWDKNTQGLVHGSLFWGYILTNVAGGILATKFGGKRVIGFSLLAASILTLFVPVVARHDAKMFMALRFFTGMSQGFVSPAMQSLWSFWAPTLESSFLRSICFAGAQLGKVLTYPVTALLCEYGLDGGWPSIFYLQGTVGVLWFISWCLMVFDTPATHPRISKDEKEYIESSLHGIMPKNLTNERNTPWRAMLSSPRVWAIIVSHTCSNWGEYTFLTNIPTYMEEVLKFDVKKNGFLSSVPYICMWIVISVSSWIADLTRKKGLLSTVVTRKIFTCIGFLLPAALLVGLSFVGCSEALSAVVLLTLGVALTGSQYGGGLYLNAGDIAPKFAGVIYGFSNTIATIPGFLAPLTIGILTENQTQDEWRSVFYLSSIIYVFGAVIFVFLGSGDLQIWAVTKTEIIINGEATFDTCLSSLTKEENSTSLCNIDAHHSSDLISGPLMKNRNSHTGNHGEEKAIIKLHQNSETGHTSITLGNHVDDNMDLEV